MKSLADLPIKIYADGADRDGMLKLYRDPLIQGMTTNPTLMRKAGISDYEKFAREILETVKTKPSPSRSSPTTSPTCIARP